MAILANGVIRMKVHQVERFQVKMRHTIISWPTPILKNLLRVSSDPQLAQSVAGVLVESSASENKIMGLSPDRKFPLAEFAPHQNLSFAWNPIGSGIMWNQHNFLD
ncbi:hypothetical protein HPP92_021001 [Vanilla planifolia]|uniref:Nicastrin n=1 Tax=Vanilla planifolia TaxID=51239 RepID=A0A835Q1I4_VANPL|nr:hypothetical protein HPP92_021313 [Vanilla planifolia]KAG0462525.1 hypothetical protein HPP92_021001 [Vanilla planifolia]